MKSISLFSGAMGLDLGLEQAEIHPLLCCSECKQESEMKQEKPVVHVKPRKYQPKKAEKEERVAYDCTCDEAIDALLRPVKIKEDL